MGNVLSAEMFKLRKEKVTLIIFLINLFLVSVFSLAIALITRFVGEELANDPDMVAMGMDVMFSQYSTYAPAGAFSLMYQFIAIYAAVFAGFFVCSEFETGTIRNTLSVGKSRSGYYLSKVITIFTASIILAVIGTAIYVGIEMLFFDFTPGDGYVVNLLLLIGGKFLVYLTYVSLFTMLAFVLRGIAATLGIAVGFAFLIELILHMILNAGFFEPVRFLQNIFPYHHVLQFNDVFLNGVSGNEITYLTSVAVCVVIIILTTVIGLFTFNKRDIK